MRAAQGRRMLLLILSIWFECFGPGEILRFDNFALRSGSSCPQTRRSVTRRSACQEQNESHQRRTAAYGITAAAVAVGALGVTVVRLGSPADGNLGTILSSVAQDPEKVVSSPIYTQEKTDKDELILLRRSGTITVKQGFGQLAQQHTGSVMWGSSQLLTIYMEEQMPADSFAGKRVLELGAGVAALGSITACRLGAVQTVSTDGDPGVLEYAKSNINRNVRSGASVTVQQLRWQSAEDIKRLDGVTWDWLLAADCTYNRNNWSKLLGTIRALSSPGTKTLLAVQVRVPDEVTSLQMLAQDMKLEWTEIKLPAYLDSSKEISPVHIFELRPL
eukprot:TRINITY_DN76079_c0_g1_i1.p1 TRINITY_DN76079_c0_g1~~TRINITY_DN76079_c0_g1_i1.p1  ORF type:complete len:332 (-),score=59.88 TRINITY_DN76079_c0_g1_i1:35-1030(-)